MVVNVKRLALLAVTTRIHAVWGTPNRQPKRQRSPAIMKSLFEPAQNGIPQEPDASFTLLKMRVRRAT